LNESPRSIHHFVINLQTITNKCSLIQRIACFLFIYIGAIRPFLYFFFYILFPPLDLSRFNFIVAELFSPNATMKGDGQMRDGLVYSRE